MRREGFSAVEGLSGTETKRSLLCVIPARGGSKGVERKNLKGLGGRPLISWVITTGKKSKSIDRLILSTDDPDIARTGEALGAEIPFLRPADLGSDQSPLISVVLHAFQFYEERGVYYDGVISLQPTAPFLKTATIDRAVETWIRTGCESVVTVAEVLKGHPYIAKRLGPDHALEEFCAIPAGAVVGPRQKRDKAYYLTGGLYLRDRRLLERAEPKGHCLGQDARGVAVDEIEAVDINTPMDFLFAEYLLQSGVVKP